MPKLCQLQLSSRAARLLSHLLQASGGSCAGRYQHVCLLGTCLVHRAAAYANELTLQDTQLELRKKLLALRISIADAIKKHHKLTGKQHKQHGTAQTNKLNNNIAQVNNNCWQQNKCCKA